MKGDAKPVFTRYDDGRPVEHLFNKEGKEYCMFVCLFVSRVGQRYQG